MKMNLQGKTVILTGASSGIGREMAKLFVLNYGANVLGIGRNLERLQSLKEELGEKFSYRAFDVSAQESWRIFAEELKSEGVKPPARGIFTPS